MLLDSLNFDLEHVICRHNNSSSYAQNLGALPYFCTVLHTYIW